MEINLQKFEPEKAKLIAKAKKYEWLKIIDENDKAWYETVHKARMDLRAERLEKDKFFDEYNDLLNQKKREWKEARDSIVWIIEPVEKHLKDEEERIDNIKEQKRLAKEEEERKIKEAEEQKKQELFNFRYNELKEVNWLPDNIMWLKEATSEEYSEYYIDKKELFKEEQRRQEIIANVIVSINNCKTLEELERCPYPVEPCEEIKSAYDKKKQELELQIQQEKIKEQQAKIDEENKKLWEAQQKIEREQQAIEKQKELDRIAEENRKQLEEKAKQDKIEAERKAKEEEELNKKRKKYQDFLKSFDYTEWTDEFTIVKTDTDMILYKKLWTFKYK